MGGALLTTFVLLRFLGTAAATIALVAALCLAALAAHRRSVPAAALLAATLFPVFDLWIEATEYVERNAYADYRIVEMDDGGRMLDVSGQAASRHDAEGRGWEYAERIEKTLCEAGETRVLVLGAAGMTLGRGAPCEMDVAFVDIDPAQRRIAGLFLQAATATSGTFAAADARAFLRSDSGGWPAIVVDTYSNPRILPQHLVTVEFYRLARSRLAEGGALYVNHLAWPGDTLFRTRAERTLRSVFADCSSGGADGWRHPPIPATCSSAAARASTTPIGRSIPTPCPAPTWTARCDDRRMAVPDPPLLDQRAQGGTSRWPPASTAGPSCWRSAWRRPAGCSGACWTPSPRASRWGLQRGVPLSSYVDQLALARFEPAGWTDSELGYAHSVVDYLARWLGLRFPDAGAVDQPATATDGETCPVCGVAVTWDPGSPCPVCGDIGFAVGGPRHGEGAGAHSGV